MRVGPLNLEFLKGHLIKFDIENCVVRHLWALLRFECQIELRNT